MDLAVGEILRGIGSEVRYAWVQICADASSSAAVDPVTCGAIAQKKFVALLQRRSIASQWVLGPAFTPRNCNISHTAGKSSFKGRRRLHGSKALPEHNDGYEAGGNRCACQAPNGAFPNFCAWGRPHHDGSRQEKYILTCGHSRRLFFLS